MRDVVELAADLGVDSRYVQPWGPHVAKLHLDCLRPRGTGRYALVTAMTPDRRGVGKTTVAIGLGDALRRRGFRTAVTLRQSSQGPSLGAKGGGGGGGRARVEPLDRALLHLTGDLHAVAAAHNAVAALLDNAWFHGAVDLAGVDVQWNRVADVNDRFLRNLEVSSGDKRRAAHFELTAASELMAILALADGTDHASVVADVRHRIGRIVLAITDESVITADDIGGAGVATALLLDAMHPNLMQSAAGTPVLLHTGPFANIAHGCSSIVADRVALSGADWVVTEAGFGAEVGLEKFFDIKARTSGEFPDVAVLIATASAVRDHGTVEDGLANLAAQVGVARRFGVPVVVAINVDETADDPADYEAIEAAAARAGAVDTVRCHAYARGVDGALALADAVIATRGHSPRVLYEADLPLADKVRVIATSLYGATDVAFVGEAAKELGRFAALGADRLPVCVAKTPYSLSGDPALRGAPTGHTLEVSDLRLSAGAGFVYALTTKVLTMPGMGSDPRARHIDVDALGRVTGLS